MTVSSSGFVTNAHKKIQLVSIQELVAASKPNILELFNDYQLTEESLLSDIKKIILHCTITQLIATIKANEILVLIDLKWNCDKDIASAVGDGKCVKSLVYMTNNLKKIFRHRFVVLNEMPTTELPGEIYDAVYRSKTFNFKSLSEFLEKCSLSGLKRIVKDDLSVKQKIFNNFQN